MRTMPVQRLAVACLALLAAAAPAEHPSAYGTWRNPKGTLAVRTAACGPGLCGAIVWANEEALSDAREAGVEKLIGTQLLQDYRAIGQGRWKGRVYVPDMGHSFPSRIVQTGPDELTISGCLIGNLFCRSQVWRRVG